MKPMPLAILAALALSPAIARDPSPGNDRARAIERGLRGPVVVAGEVPVPMALADRMSFYKVPGVSIAVIDRGRIVWVQGYGSARAGQPVTPRTQFQTGSISKPVTAVAAMRLVDAGRLDLDADVDRVLLAWKVPPSPLATGRPVTLRGLLSHGAGLNLHSFYPGYEPGRPVPTALQVLNGQPPAMNEPVRVVVRPGGEWKYSGGGYQVVQQLLTERAAADFETVMRRQLFVPLGMTRSSFVQLTPQQAPVTVATGHDRKGEELPSRWLQLPEAAAAGLRSTPTDLARLVIALQRSWNGERGAILSRATAREMFRRQTGEWGLGFGIEGQGSGLRFRHSGDNPGYKAVVVGFPETGQGAVILTNGDRGVALINEILLAIAAEYRWPDYAPKVKTRVAVEPASLARLEGSYALDAAPQVRLVVARRGAGLVLRIVQPGGEQESELLASAPDRFFRRDIDFEMHFAPGGRAQRLTLYQDGQVFQATRTTDAG